MRHETLDVDVDVVDDDDEGERGERSHFLGKLLTAKEMECAWYNSLD